MCDSLYTFERKHSTSAMRCASRAMPLRNEGERDTVCTYSLLCFYLRDKHQTTRTCARIHLRRPTTSASINSPSLCIPLPSPPSQYSTACSKRSPLTRHLPPSRSEIICLKQTMLARGKSSKKGQPIYIDKKEREKERRGREDVGEAIEGRDEARRRRVSS